MVVGSSTMLAALLPRSSCGVPLLVTVFDQILVSHSSEPVPVYGYGAASSSFSENGSGVVAVPAIGPRFRICRGITGIAAEATLFAKTHETLSKSTEDAIDISMSITSVALVVTAVLAFS